MISVLTPSYNSSTTLERCIASVLDQNVNDFEHIVVDGGSSDDTLRILKKYEHVKWISEPDRGQSDAMNKAFSMSSGDIIVFLNADDILYPCTLEACKKRSDRFRFRLHMLWIIGGFCIHSKRQNRSIETNSSVVFSI